MGITTTSRKKEGAAVNNRHEVREMVGQAKRYAEGICVVTDKAGNEIYVDTINGLTALMRKVINIYGIVENSYVWYEDGTTSTKANGYVYTPLSIVGINGRVQTIQYGTHSLVAMLAHTKEYDALDNEDKTPIANHKNNKSWDNSRDNLEWSTQGGNTRHGKVVVSLQRYFPDQYSSIQSNAGDTEFVVLDTALSVKDIERYCIEIDTKDEFKCANNEYINCEVINDFVDWLIDNNIWSGHIE